MERKASIGYEPSVCQTLQTKYPISLQKEMLLFPYFISVDSEANKSYW